MVLVPGETGDAPLAVADHIVRSSNETDDIHSPPRQVLSQIVIDAVQPTGSFGKPADTDLKGGDAPGGYQGERRPFVRRVGCMFRQGHKEYHPGFKVRFS